MFVSYLLFFQYVLQQIRCILIAGHAFGDAIGVGNLIRKLYLEAIVVETVGIFLLHLGEFEVVGGDDASDRKVGYALQEQTRAVELVELVGAFENFVKDDERMAVLLAIADELL